MISECNKQVGATKNFSIYIFPVQSINFQLTNMSNPDVEGKRASSTRGSILKSRKLSDLVEQIIIRFIFDLDSRGFPPRLLHME